MNQEKFVTVTVELGRTKMRTHDLLQLGQGSVIELTKLVGEPLELLVNEKLVARGKIVVVNEKFGIRLTDVVSPEDRKEERVNQFIEVVSICGGALALAAGLLSGQFNGALNELFRAFGYCF